VLVRFFFFFFCLLPSPSTPPFKSQTACVPPLGNTCYFFPSFPTPPPFFWIDPLLDFRVKSGPCGTPPCFVFLRKSCHQAFSFSFFRVLFFHRYIRGSPIAPSVLCPPRCRLDNWVGHGLLGFSILFPFLSVSSEVFPHHPECKCVRNNWCSLFRSESPSPRFFFFFFKTSPLNYARGWWVKPPFLLDVGSSRIRVCNDENGVDSRLSFFFPPFALSSRKSFERTIQPRFP